MNKTKIWSSFAIMLILTLSLAAAMTVDSVKANNFAPGEEQSITLDVENTLNNDVEDVTLTIDASNLPFTILSIEDIDDIDEDDSESVKVKVKAMGNAPAGDYSIPYILKYTEKKAEEDKDGHKEGTFVLTVEANPDLAYSITTEKPVVGLQGKIKFTIVNKGLGNAKFVDVKIIPQGYTALTAPEEYIGTISSDDFENVNMNVIFEDKNPSLVATIEYRDFNNKKIIKNVNLPIEVYTPEEALKLGLIQQNNTVMYSVVGGIVIVGFFIVRRVLKKRKQNKLQGR